MVLCIVHKLHVLKGSVIIIIIIIIHLLRQQATLIEYRYKKNRDTLHTVIGPWSYNHFYPTACYLLLLFAFNISYQLPTCNGTILLKLFTYEMPLSPSSVIWYQPVAFNLYILYNCHFVVSCDILVCITSHVRALYYCFSADTCSSQMSFTTAYSYIVVDVDSICCFPSDVLYDDVCVQVWRT